MGTVYVTGHRNPDTDSIAAAIGYAELKGRLDPRNEYVPSRLGELNAQTRWVLDRSGAPEPELLPHVLLRVRDVMLARFPTVSHREPIRQVGRSMAREDLELMPIVDDDGALAGVMTERTLARRYIRESREATSLSDAAASPAVTPASRARRRACPTPPPRSRRSSRSPRGGWWPARSARSPAGCGS